MIKDQLKRGERIRLEALAQAVAHRQMNHSSGSVLKTAREFEKFIRDVTRLPGEDNEDNEEKP